MHIVESSEFFTHTKKNHLPCVLTITPIYIISLAGIDIDWERSSREYRNSIPVLR